MMLLHNVGLYPYRDHASFPNNAGLYPRSTPGRSNTGFSPGGSYTGLYTRGNNVGLYARGNNVGSSSAGVNTLFLTMLGYMNDVVTQRWFIPLIETTLAFLITLVFTPGVPQG
jgi:hypothetical protein